jgi:hypothetical protein
LIPESEQMYYKRNRKPTPNRTFIGTMTEAVNKLNCNGNKNAYNVPQSLDSPLCTRWQPGQSCLNLPDQKRHPSNISVSV